MRNCLLIVLLLNVLICSAQRDQEIRGYKKDTGYFVSFDKSKIYYEVYGEGNPVLLIHGFINSGQNWKNTWLFQDLITNGRKVIIVDLRGNGRSDKPHNDDAYIHDAEARDLMLLTRYLKLGKYDIVGYSRGSIIAVRLLVLDKKVHTAVLGGMGTGFTNPNWPRRIMFYETLTGKPAKELESMLNYVRSQGFDTTSLALQQKYQPSTSESALSRIKRKVLVISGDKDTDNGSAEDLCKMIRNSIFISVPGNHNDASRSKEFSEAVVSFLK